MTPVWSETETLRVLWRLLCSTIADDNLRFAAAAALVMVLTAQGY